MFEAKNYGPVFSRLLDVDRNQQLDAGSFSSTDSSQLQDLSVVTAFEHSEPVDAAMAEACLAGVWLLYDFLDKSHSISQGIKTREGSFWHGIMHRREGDYSNAKYWFRNVGEHPVYQDLASVAQQFTVDSNEDAALGILGSNDWDPYRFVDLCQTSVQEGRGGALLRSIQQAEWELLFDYCYRAAVG